MTREEYCNSPMFLKLRFLNNIAAEIQYKTTSMNDILQIILSENKDLCACDKFSLVESQIRIVTQDADKLWERCRQLAERLTPKLEQT